MSTNSSFREKGLTDYSSIGPSLLHQDLGSAFEYKKLSLFVLQQKSKTREQASPGPLKLSLGNMLDYFRSEVPSVTSSPSTQTNVRGISSTGSIAAMLESELDESTRVRGWFQMRDNPEHLLQWSVSMSDLPEDEMGWGLSLGGLTHGSRRLDQFQAEAFLKFNLSKKLSLQ
ncbi:Ventricular zone-expressed PH domain-containing protein [Bienertia sinuspersici]